MVSRMKYYKFLTEENTGGYSDFIYPVKPDGSTKWLRCKGYLKMCSNGFHLTTKEHLVSWLGKHLYEAEYQGRIIEGDNKICCRKIRLVKKVDAWNEKTARLFACDCAEHVLHIFEKQYPNDKRPRIAIEVARKYANGLASDKELNTARAAAWDAARAAAWDAAWDARDPAEAQWQNEKLREYLGK